MPLSRGEVAASCLVFAGVVGGVLLEGLGVSRARRVFEQSIWLRALDQTSELSFAVPGEAIEVSENGSVAKGLRLGGSANDGTSFMGDLRAYLMMRKCYCRPRQPGRT